ncbi:MAG: hypothetical protein ABIJ41_07955 [Candidatus Omnitrophota bacterium]
MENENNPVTEQKPNCRKARPSKGVIACGILSILMGSTGSLLSMVMFISVVSISPIAMIMFLPAALYIIGGVSLFYLRNWARMIIVSMSTIYLALFGPYMFVMYIIYPFGTFVRFGRQPSLSFFFSLITLGLMFLLKMLPFAVLVYFLTRPMVKQQFCPLLSTKDQTGPAVAQRSEGLCSLKDQLLNQLKGIGLEKSKDILILILLIMILLFIGKSLF